MGTTIIEAGADVDDFLGRAESVFANAATRRHQALVVGEADAVEAAAAAAQSRFGSVTGLAYIGGTGRRPTRTLLQSIREDRVAFLPAGASHDTPPWNDIDPDADEIMPWAMDPAVPALTCAIHETVVAGWLMPAKLTRSLLAGALSTPACRLADIYRAANGRVEDLRWKSPGVGGGYELPAAAHGGVPPIARDSTVLVVIPHYACEQWLDQCLESVVNQTRTPDAIAVIDDGSPHPPVETCRRRPSVTLLRSARNVGPYRLLQEIVDRTAYRAYMFQDSDDWSSYDRLELLLTEAERTHAELIGSQEIRVEDDDTVFRPVCYPVDVNLASREKPRHPLLHPTSIVSRRLVSRLGGFATGLRFCGDTEFLYRAVFDARIVNIPRFSYFRRRRAGALTTARDTGLEAPLRHALWDALHRRASQNKELIAKGELPILDPICADGPVELDHILGPELVSA